MKHTDDPEARVPEPDLVGENGDFGGVESQAFQQVLEMTLATWSRPRSGCSSGGKRRTDILKPLRVGLLISIRLSCIGN